jgi:hypothetical protein
MRVFFKDDKLYCIDGNSMTIHVYKNGDIIRKQNYIKDGSVWRLASFVICRPGHRPDTGA